MDRKSIDFARHWAKRYVREHRPYGLDESDVENMILRRLHYNKDKGERGRKAALSSALNEAQDERRRNFRALVPWQVKRGMPVGVLARDMHAVASRQRVRERDRLAVRLTIARISPDDRQIAELYMELLNWKKVAARLGIATWMFRLHVLPGFVSRFQLNGAQASTIFGESGMRAHLSFRKAICRIP